MKDKLTKPAALPVRYVTAAEDSEIVVAAVIRQRMDRRQLDETYKRLPHEARLQIALARRWRCWAVLAPDSWATEHGLLEEAP